MTNAVPDSDSTIRVLVVDDSPYTRATLIKLIQEAPDMEVIGEATNGLEAVRMNHSLHPSIIAMNLNLPVMDGLRATRFIMTSDPNRIVLFTREDQLHEDGLMASATAAGALDVCVKPRHNSSEEVGMQFIKTLRALAQVKVVQRRKTGELPSLELNEEDFSNYPGIEHRPELVAIVASTGGPNALELILSALPADFPLPVVVLQHIEEDFMGNLVEWLDRVTSLVSRSAEHREFPKPGHIYFAPSGTHLSIAFNGCFSLSEDRQGYLHVPSGDILLESVARVYGPNAIGVLLTGMGHDGASGLNMMRQRGARTIVQDEASSVVFGMPKEAIDLGAAEFVTPLEKIAGLLLRLCNEGLESQKEV